MAKKVRFPLDMGNEVYVRTLEELKENYNSEKVTEYFLEGRLLIWLNDRYYEEEAAAVGELAESGGKENLAAKLGKIFGVEIQDDVDVENLEIRREKLEKLREITSDDEILDNVDHVAFSQEELGDLLDDEINVIYLCGKSFRIPLGVKNVRYVGVNNPAVVISGNGEINLEANGITIERCELPEKLEEKISLPQSDSEYKIKLYVPKQTQIAEDNNTVLAAEYGNKTQYIYFRYDDNINYNYDECINIYSCWKKGGHYAYDNYLCLSETEVYNSYESKKKVYIKGNPNSVFDIFKNQMLEALKNLPKAFEKKDGFVDINDEETIAAVEEAVRIFIKKYDFNQSDTDNDNEEYDYDYEKGLLSKKTAAKKKAIF